MERSRSGAVGQEAATVSSAACGGEKRLPLHMRLYDAVWKEPAAGGRPVAGQEPMSGDGRLQEDAGRSVSAPAAGVGSGDGPPMPGSWAVRPYWGFAREAVPSEGRRAWTRKRSG